MRVVITGFEPYLEYAENSSWEVARAVASRDNCGVEVVAELLPVSFTRVGDALRGAVERNKADYIILLGQSGGSDRVKLERIAINMMDARNVDNDGFLPDEQPIDQSDSAALFTTLPVKALRSAIEAKGVKVKISNSAGLYVCNRSYFEALRLCREQRVKGALFVHLPYYEGQKSAKPGKTTMALEDMVTAIQTIIINITTDK